jgi:hypothetical protein
VWFLGGLNNTPQLAPAEHCTVGGSKRTLGRIPPRGVGLTWLTTGEQLDEAEESLGQARQALAQAEDGGGNTLQQVVDMQDELRVVRQEVKYRQEGEQLMGEAEEGLFCPSVVSHF